ncbi:hypothetical protein GQ42DRAFT_158713 [Ramicandelaber brevisporus]|nr:hypothetical protein GQ42DRAFT_158713 [Ramicandelaber brevisporus]
MAWHIAKGFLFLSAGNAAPVIDSTKLSNVALLVCSLFPLFPTSPTENRCHLQPLRHLWALTTRRHVLVVRDADDGHSLNEKCQVKIIQHFGDKTRRVQSATLPAVLPDLSSRLGFVVECDGYWPLVQQVARCIPLCLKQPQQKRQETDIDDIELRIAAELSRLSIPVNITH